MPVQEKNIIGRVLLPESTCRILDTAAIQIARTLHYELFDEAVDYFTAKMEQELIDTINLHVEVANNLMRARFLADCKVHLIAQEQAKSYSVNNQVRV